MSRLTLHELYGSYHSIQSLAIVVENLVSSLKSSSKCLSIELELSGRVLSTTEGESHQHPGSCNELE